MKGWTIWGWIPVKGKGLYFLQNITRPAPWPKYSPSPLASGLLQGRSAGA
jgi:hypothetical protein